MDTEATDHLSDDDLAELARFADGTLPEAQRAEVEARVTTSPQLTSIVERQGVALNAIRATASAGAPARLRADIERQRGGRRAGRASPGGRRFVLAGSLAAVAAAVLLAVVLTLSSSGPSVNETVALGEKPPTEPAPAPVPGTPQLLNASVEDVPFPNYAAKFGWKPAGARDDDPSGRDTTTVFYGKDGREIAYSIVSGEQLAEPDDARVIKRGGVEYRTFREDDRNAVTWLRDGQTCVLSGEDVTTAELVELADWRGMGAIPF